ncbi:hypothetical protein NA56DRAFT_14539 [Hyaloscypha hepaticicola]|uniref:Uncharacterized protein n=1 Tax=Hyaloscypha hepaticicola TaxID=2082293 RepID=A0A2J6QQ96_9HELO|nr:hypothetical protein NA56DRAFT_14539 [Hyaloscypha hepaticicola]
MQSSIFAIHLSRMIRLNGIITRRHSHTLSPLMPRQSPTQFQPLSPITNQHLTNVSQPCVRLLPAESLSFQRPGSNHTDRTARSKAYPTLPTIDISSQPCLVPNTQNFLNETSLLPLIHPKQSNHNIFPIGSTLPAVPNQSPSHFPDEIGR